MTDMNKPFTPVNIPIIRKTFPSLMAADFVDNGEGVKMLQEVIALIRNLAPDMIGERLLGAQNMQTSADAVKQLMADGKSESWLLENGYKPVCEHTKLMWVKKDGV